MKIRQIAPSRMADTFDPYYKWLAIPPKDQPPNHYRLLGVEPFEPDADVIESAADQRMAHVRSFQTGQNSALSQKVLKVEIDLPAVRFDRLRVEVTRCEGFGGGLAEVEVWRGERNLAWGCPVVASGAALQSCRASNLTDGATSSGELWTYWLLPDANPGWAEIDLSSNEPAIGGANGRLGAYRAFVENDWSLGLSWLARSDDAELRRLAARDLDDLGGFEQMAAIGDGWWDMAQLLDGRPRQRVLARAMYRYARALPAVPADEQARLRRRLAEGLADKPASARFDLAGKYQRLTDAAALSDSAKQPASAVTFQISGDGRTLWRSQPLAERGASEPFVVDVRGVNSLELSAMAAGLWNWCHALWIDPKLEE